MTAKDIMTRIRRGKAAKTAFFDMADSRPWALYVGRSVDDIDYSAPLLSGSDAGTYPLSVDEATRSYFALRTDAGTALLAERLLPMTGGYNFRDLGGIETTDGRRVVWGRLFRADDMKSLTEHDLDYLASIPITTVIDFRTEFEIGNAPDRLPVSVRSYLPYSIMPGRIDLAAMRALDPHEAKAEMLKIYGELALHEPIMATYRAFFACLQDEENAPVLFHCSAGKDRTGIGAALVLFALGADTQAVMDDYMASKEYLAGKYEAHSVLFSVDPDFLLAAIDRVERSYGSVENYLVRALDVDLEKMRALYLY